MKLALKSKQSARIFVVKNIFVVHRILFAILLAAQTPFALGQNAKISAVQNPKVPDAIKVPAGEKLVLIARATGSQIYVCRPDAAGQPAWTLKAPEAQLFDHQGNVIGKHFGGPTWKHNDGSEIVGKMAAKVEAPDASAIPWLLVNVTDHSGSGAFSGITTIQRIHTTGGLPPAGSCKESDAEVKSSYTADYYFYARQ